MKSFVKIFSLLLIVSACEFREPLPPYEREDGYERMEKAVEQTNTEESIITANRVNVREKPNVSSKIIAQLNENDRVVVIEELKEEITIGAYSSWVKIQLHDDRIGYISSSFVNSINAKVQSFHDFFREFKHNWQEQNEVFLLKFIDFPLVFTVFENRQKNTHKVSSIEELFEYLIIDDNTMSDFLFTAKIDNKYEVDYSYTGFSYTLYFRLVNKQWKLEKVFKSIM